VRVSLLEQDAGKGRPAIRFECVTVEVAAVDERHLASIASPLLVVDLPDFLWWVGDTLAGSELFSDLLEVSDRVIVDSGAFLDPSAELRHLSALLCRAQGCPRLSDFAWARLVPWRQVITQFFDPPPARDALASLDEVTITYGNASATSGFTAALLLAGWLGSRLDWQPPGELVPARDDPGAWRATLRAGARGRRRELVLTLRRSPSPVAGPSLGQVLLAAHGTAAARFHVERTDPLGLSTLSSTREKPEVRRLVYAEEPDDAALLADELRIFGRDPVFEAALAFASGLVPDSFTAGGAS
jgi:glucose-6-phosphate dehydrogenase assembly protein OpcA